MSAAVPRLKLLNDEVRDRLESKRAERTLELVRTPAAQSWVQLRRAEPADAEAIHELLERYVVMGVMLPRTLGQIYRSIRDFVVADEAGVVVGCGALKIYSERLAEVGALAVAPSMQGHGVGRRVVETLLDDARALRIKRVFALTMQVEFFHRLGFERVAITEFPEKQAADCASCARRLTCPETAVARTV